MPVSDAVGKIGDLGDCPGDKIRTLIRLDGDPDCMFLLQMACYAIAFQIYAILLYCTFQISPTYTLYIVDLGALCASS